MLLLKTVGNVELWTSERSIEQEKNVRIVKEPWTLPKPVSTRKVDQDQWLKSTAAARVVIDAIPLAPQMTQAALRRVNDLLAWRAAAQGDNERQKKATLTAQALFKYFNMPDDMMNRGADDPVWGYVRKVVKVYEKIQAGLRGRHKLYIYEKKDNVTGYVEANVEGMSASLKAFFAATPDENGHVPLTHVATNDIHLNQEWLKRVNTDPNATNIVAKTIVHEASHKWAFTNDKCYKHNTLNKDKVNSTAFKIKDGQLPAIQRADRPNKPLTAFTSKDLGNRFSMEDWLLNADSYAWMARRLWKAETNKGKLPYELDAL